MRVTIGYVAKVPRRSVFTTFRGARYLYAVHRRCIRWVYVSILKNRTIPITLYVTTLVKSGHLAVRTQSWPSFGPCKLPCAHTWFHAKASKLLFYHNPSYYTCTSKFSHLLSIPKTSAFLLHMPMVLLSNLVVSLVIQSIRSLLCTVVRILQRE